MAPSFTEFFGIKDQCIDEAMPGLVSLCKSRNVEGLENDADLRVLTLISVLNSAEIYSHLRHRHLP